MANQVPISLKQMLMKGQIAFVTAGGAAADTFKMILMQPGFVFNKDTMFTYALVAASELPTAGGYTVGGVTLAGIALAWDIATDRVTISWSNASWTASATLQASGAIIYDDSTAMPGDDYTDAIISYKDAGGTVTAVSGTPIVVSNIKEIIGDI